MKKLFLFLSLLFVGLSVNAQFSPSNNLNYVKLIKTPPSGTTTDQMLVYDSADQFVKMRPVDTDNREAVNDVNKIITGTANRLIAYTAITADRTVTLPPATTANQRIWITDESGLCSNARRIIVAPNGSDVIGGDSFSVINFPNGSGYLESNGVGKWNIISTTAIQFSSGVNTLPSYTDNGNGSVTLGTGVYSLYANTNGTGRPKAYQIAGGTFTMTDNSDNFIYAQYNTTTGAVSLQQSTTDAVINDLTTIPIYSIYRQGLTLHPRDFDTQGVALANKLNRSIQQTQKVRIVEGGVLLGETSTPAVRTVTVSAGTAWVGATEITLGAVNSATSTCYRIFPIAGVYQTTSVVTQYDNTQYSDGTNLQTLTAGRYGVRFIYRSIGNDNDMAIVVGTGDNTLGQAQVSVPPANLPSFLRHMVLVGRIIIEKNASTATQIDQNVSGTNFASAGVTDHNALNNLQTAQAGVTYGHITDASQSIAGDKNFLGNINAANKQNSLATDGTGVKFPTVDAVSGGTAYKITISQIRALSGTLPNTNFYTTDLGQEGNWYYDASDITSADNTGTILVTADGKRIKRVFENVIDVRWFGAKGDNSTDDTVAIQTAINSNNSNIQINFSTGVYKFTTVNIVDKTNFIVSGSGSSVLDGLIKIYNSTFSNNYANNITLKDLNFNRGRPDSAVNKNAIQIEKCSVIKIDKCTFKGVDKCIYISPLNVFQHVSKISITNCSSSIADSNLYSAAEKIFPYVYENLGYPNYFYYVDNPYPDNVGGTMTFGAGDATISNCNPVFASKSHIYVLGQDGLVVTNNIMFFPGGFYRSQFKNQNIYGNYVDWVVISNNDLFEAGKESILLKWQSDVNITGNNVAWCGQRDGVNGWGVRLTGGGVSPAGNRYVSSNISMNNFRQPSGGGVKIDPDQDIVTVNNNVITSAGNTDTYYGDGTQPPGTSAVPALTLPKVGIYVDATCYGAVVTGNNSPQNPNTLPKSTATSLGAVEYSGPINKNNYINSGDNSGNQVTVTTITAGAISLSGTERIFLNVGAGGSVTTISGGKNGDLVSIYNGSTAITFTHNSSIQLAGGVSFVLDFRHTLNLKNIGGIWYETSRSVDTSLYASDTSVMHRTGSVNESFSGIKSATNTGATQINGFDLTNNGTTGSQVLNITSTSSGRGINLSSSGSSTSAAITNSGTANALLIFNQSTGFGVNIDNASTGISAVLNSQTLSTGDLLQFKKNNVLTTKVDQNGIITTTTATAGTNTNQVATTAFASRMHLLGYTVATLPSSPVQGDTAYVTDATAPTYLGALTGGGSVVCPVFYNGAAWVSH